MGSLRFLFEGITTDVTYLSSWFRGPGELILVEEMQTSKDLSDVFGETSRGRPAEATGCEPALPSGFHFGRPRLEFILRRWLRRVGASRPRPQTADGRRTVTVQRGTQCHGVRCKDQVDDGQVPRAHRSR